MTLPGAPSLFFLFLLLVFLPWASLRSARTMRNTSVSRERIWVSTIISQILLLALSLLIGRTFDFEPFAIHAIAPKHILAAIAALAICFALRAISRSIRSEEEQRNLAVYRWAPRAPKEWMLWTIGVILASIGEEIAYRGVGMAILHYSFGTPIPAAIILSIAFALAHATQGWKSACIIFILALTMHALVWFTSTLLLAMLVHALYDFASGALIARDARRFA